MLHCSHYIMWFHCIWFMSGLTRLLIRVHEKIQKKKKKKKKLHVQGAAEIVKHFKILVK